MKGSLQHIPQRHDRGRHDHVSRRQPEHKDFLNLMEVYLDRVFDPLLHSVPQLFWQEGGHYEINDGKLS